QRECGLPHHADTHRGEVARPDDVAARSVGQCVGHQVRRRRCRRDEPRPGWNARYVGRRDREASGIGTALARWGDVGTRLVFCLRDWGVPTLAGHLAATLLLGCAHELPRATTANNARSEDQWLASQACARSGARVDASAWRVDDLIPGIGDPVVATENV